MRAFFSDIIPKIQNFSKKIDDLVLLTNQHWVIINDIEKEKNVYIFRKNNELIISQNGEVEKAKWEYLGNNSLLIELSNKTLLFKQGFFDEYILALKLDGKDEYVYFVNESKFEKNLNSSKTINDFLKTKYIKKIDEPKKEQILEKKEVPIILHQTPKYILKNDIDKNSFFVEFNDGLKGALFCKKKENLFFFKAKAYGMWIKTSHYYENIESCIIGLHYFLTTGKIYEIGFISSNF